MNKRVKGLIRTDSKTKQFVSYLCVFPTYKAPLYDDSTFGDEDTEHPEDKLTYQSKRKRKESITATSVRDIFLL